MAITDVGAISEKAKGILPQEEVVVLWVRVSLLSECHGMFCSERVLGGRKYDLRFWC